MLLNPDSSMHSVEPPRVSKLKVFRVYSVSVKSVNTAHFKVSKYFYVRGRSTTVRGTIITGAHAFLCHFNFGAGTNIDSPATISPMEHSIHYL